MSSEIPYNTPLTEVLTEGQLHDLQNELRKVTSSFLEISLQSVCREWNTDIIKNFIKAYVDTSQKRIKCDSNSYDQHPLDNFDNQDTFKLLRELLSTDELYIGDNKIGDKPYQFSSKADADTFKQRFKIVAQDYQFRYRKLKSKFPQVLIEVRNKDISHTTNNSFPDQIELINSAILYAEWVRLFKQEVDTGVSVHSIKSDTKVFYQRVKSFNEIYHRNILGLKQIEDKFKEQIARKEFILLEHQKKINEIVSEKDGITKNYIQKCKELEEQGNNQQQLLLARKKYEESLLEFENRLADSKQEVDDIRSQKSIIENQLIQLSDELKEYEVLVLREKKKKKLVYAYLIVVIFIFSITTFYITTKDALFTNHILILANDRVPTSAIKTLDSVLGKSIVDPTFPFSTVYHVVSDNVNKPICSFCELKDSLRTIIPTNFTSISRSLDKITTLLANQKYNYYIIAGDFPLYPKDLPPKATRLEFDNSHFIRMKDISVNQVYIFTWDTLKFSSPFSITQPYCKKLENSKVKFIIRKINESGD